MTIRMSSIPVYFTVALGTVYILLLLELSRALNPMH